jgi:hypothetical protein
MRIHNVHRRRLAATPARVGALIDTLSSAEDRLWPGDAWPPMRFDRPLGVGADGGHGPIRYHVEAYEPGRFVIFRFSGPAGLSGTHRFEVERDGEGAILGHVIDGGAIVRFAPVWILVFRPLHDALIEDAFDRAEAACTGSVERPARWSAWVRFLRRRASRRR